MTTKRSVVPARYFKDLQNVLNNAQKDSFHTVVNAPFLFKVLTTTIDLGIIVLLLVDESTQTINRVALSDTELAKGAVRVSAVPFHDIKIPLHVKENCIATSVMTHTMQMTDDWYKLFTPVLTIEQARLNQVGASIECSIVQPLGNKKGAMIFSFYQPPEAITYLHVDFTKKYAQMAARSLHFDG